MEPYYQKDNVTLFLGDCCTVLSTLPENSVNVIFADPPYRLSNDGLTCQAGKLVSVNKGEWDRSEGIENDFKFHEEWIQSCQRVLKPEGTIWVSGTYHSIYTCGYVLMKLGFWILNDICWYKPNAAPHLSGRRFTASHETLIWAKKDVNAKYTFNYQEMKESIWEGDDLKQPNKQMRSVWKISTTKPSEKVFGRHPTQKPLPLLRRILRSSTLPRDLVVDPFTGSSTTGVACKELERRFIGIDNNKEYLDLSIKRLEHIS